MSSSYGSLAIFAFLIYISTDAQSGTDEPQNTAAPPIFEVPITNELGEPIGTLTVNAGQSGSDAVDSFCISNNLNEGYCAQLLQALCNRQGFPCKILATQTVNDHAGAVLGTIVIYEGKSASQTIAAFCRKFGWGYQQCKILFSRLCKIDAVECVHLLHMPVTLDEEVGPLGILQVYDGQDVVGAVMHFCTMHANQMLKKQCQVLLSHACAVPAAASNCQIFLAIDHVWIPAGVMAEKADLGPIKVLEGQPILHATHSFCSSKQLEPALCAFVVHQVCAEAAAKNATCDLQRPILALPIADENGAARGTLNVYHGQEPVDAIVKFIREKELPEHYTGALIRTLCEEHHGRELQCSRRRGALQAVPIVVPASAVEHEANSEGDQYFAGTLYIWDKEEEVADAVFNFWQHNSLPLEIRWPILQELCKSELAKCSRPEGMLASLPVSHEGKDKGKLELFEFQDPADAVLYFAEDKGMMEKRQMLMEALCQAHQVAPLCKNGRDISQARRQLFDMQLTFQDLTHKIRYLTNTGSGDSWDCDEVAQGMGEECVHMALVTAREFCSRFALSYRPGNCEADIVRFVGEQLDSWENRRWAGKEYYEYLDVPIDADLGTIEIAYRRQLRNLGSKAAHQSRRYKLDEAYATLSDPEKKAYYDQPCGEFPGLSGMCVKHLPGGGMNIICGGKM